MEPINVLFSDQKNYVFTKQQILNIPYFKNIFNSELQESSQDTINIYHNSKDFRYIHEYFTLNIISGDDIISDAFLKQCDYFMTNDLLDIVIKNSSPQILLKKKLISNIEAVILFLDEKNIINEKVFKDNTEYISFYNSLCNSNIDDLCVHNNNNNTFMDIILDNNTYIEELLETEYRIIDNTNKYDILFQIFKLNSKNIFKLLRYFSKQKNEGIITKLITTFISENYDILYNQYTKKIIIYTCLKYCLIESSIMEKLFDMKSIDINIKIDDNIYLIEYFILEFRKYFNYDHQKADIINNIILKILNNKSFNFDNIDILPIILNLQDSNQKDLFILNIVNNKKYKLLDDTIIFKFLIDKKYQYITDLLRNINYKRHKFIDNILRILLKYYQKNNNNDNVYDIIKYLITHKDYNIYNKYRYNSSIIGKFNMMYLGYIFGGYSNIPKVINLIIHTKDFNKDINIDNNDILSPVQYILLINNIENIKIMYNRPNMDYYLYSHLPDEIVKSFIIKYYDGCEYCNKSESLITMMIEFNNYDMLDLLINGCKIYSNRKNIFGRCILSQAMYKNNMKIFKLLLKCGIYENSEYISIYNVCKNILDLTNNDNMEYMELFLDSYSANSNIKRDMYFEYIYDHYYNIHKLKLFLEILIDNNYDNIIITHIIDFLISKNDIFLISFIIDKYSESFRFNIKSEKIFEFIDNLKNHNDKNLVSNFILKLLRINNNDNKIIPNISNVILSFNIDVLNELIKFNMIDYNEIDSYGNTLLMNSIIEKKDDYVKILSMISDKNIRNNSFLSGNDLLYLYGYTNIFSYINNYISL